MLPLSRGGTVNLSAAVCWSSMSIHGQDVRAPIRPDGMTFPAVYNAARQKASATTARRFRAQRIEVFGIGGQSSEHHRSSFGSRPFALLSDERFVLKGR